MGLNLQQFCEGKTLMRENREGARGKVEVPPNHVLGLTPVKEGGKVRWTCPKLLGSTKKFQQSRIKDLCLPGTHQP